MRYALLISLLLALPGAQAAEPPKLLTGPCQQWLVPPKCALSDKTCHQNYDNPSCTMMDRQWRKTQNPGPPPLR